MFNLTEYLKAVTPKIETSKFRKSEVEEATLNIINKWIKENRPTLLKDIADTLGKPMQQLHQLVKKSQRIKKYKVKGRTLLIPVETSKISVK